MDRGYLVTPLPFNDWMEHAAKMDHQGMVPLLDTFKSLPNIGETPTQLHFSTEYGRRL